jgi:desulfoferrodoxin (superoxide reductase-like protein)
MIGTEKEIIGMGVVVMYVNDFEVKTLVELTEHFIDFLDVLYKKGTITENQFLEMTEKKIEFINKMKNNNISLKA